MNFGERIYELRSQMGMSQGDLADSLDVSRQAVSKWENNSAVPELDKLLKMSELFGVSLDELVKGTVIPDTEAKAEKTHEKEEASVIVKTSLPMRKIVGLVLFCMAFITALVFFFMGGPAGFIYAIPFVVFGAICFFCEKYTGLKCLWAAYVMIIMFVGLFMGIFVFDVSQTFEWTYQMNYGRLAIAWALVVFSAFIVFYTAKRTKNEPLKAPEKAKKNLIFAWLSVVGVFVVVFAFNKLISYIFLNAIPEESIQLFSNILILFSVFKEYIYTIAFTLAASFTAKYIKLKKEQ
ncbi:MAG: helix-turn-helix transcriptional regulator [Clostridia bacterium]|nr:helix-turn-helix transcriptional regulator [Clostridia bacterium]